MQGVLKKKENRLLISKLMVSRIVDGSVRFLGLFFSGAYSDNHYICTAVDEYRRTKDEIKVCQLAA